MQFWLKTMKSKIAINTHIFLLAFLGISAIGGGGALIISPSGKLLGGLPLSILKNSPFQDFLFPGIILFLVLGILPCLVVYALIKKPENKWAERLNFFKDMYWAWSFSIYIAFALIIWLQVEMFFIQAVNWLHNFYMIWAIFIIFVALLPEVRSFYRNKPLDI
jgi:magnesium-transporting ATPase (P-type)